MKTIVELCVVCHEIFEYKMRNKAKRYRKTCGKFTCTHRYGRDLHQNERQDLIAEAELIKIEKLGVGYDVLLQKFRGKLFEIPKAIA